MSSDWVTALDGLAAGGVIDFDAAAYLLDRPARYVGNPRFEDLPVVNTSLLPKGTKMKGQSKSDGLDYQNGNVVQNPSWKKWAFGGILAAIAGGTILARLISKGKIKMPKINIPDNIKTSFKNICSTALNYIKKPFVWISGKIKKS